MRLVFWLKSLPSNRLFVAADGRIVIGLKISFTFATAWFSANVELFSGQFFGMLILNLDLGSHWSGITMYRTFSPLFCLWWSNFHNLLCSSTSTRNFNKIHVCHAHNTFIKKYKCFHGINAIFLLCHIKNNTAAPATLFWEFSHQASVFDFLSLVHWCCCHHTQ